MRRLHFTRFLSSEDSIRGFVCDIVDGPMHDEVGVSPAGTL